LVIETQIENGKKMTQLKIFQFMKWPPTHFLLYSYCTMRRD
jgi:hypothetical protein